MDGLALVLAGGGGKGAYQIGVWRALREFGVDRNIGAVSGTSVGALNAALFLQGDYEVAEGVWTSISHDQILKVDPMKQAKRWLDHPLVDKASVLAGIGTGFTPRGIFSRDGLLRIIEDHIRLDRITRSPIVGYAACCELPMLSPVYFKLNGTQSGRLTQILLASSALPLAFDSVSLDGKDYLDGGLKDNVPVKPLYDAGYRVFLVVHLSRDSMLDKSLFPEARFIEFVPREDQGTLVKGTLDFSKEGAIRRIRQGYEDAVRILKPMYEMGLVQTGLHKAMLKLKEDESGFQRRRGELLKEREAVKKELDSFFG